MSETTAGSTFVREGVDACFVYGQSLPTRPSNLQAVTEAKRFDLRRAGIS